MNLPLSAWHYEIVIYASEHKAGLTQNFKVIVVYPAYSREEYTNRMSYEGTWTGWVKTATATKPTVYDLPLAAGCQRALPEPCEYRKSQEGRVYVTAWIIRTSGNFAENEHIATLPEGYRPAVAIVRHADCANGGSPSGYCHAHIAPSGGITIAGVQQVSNWLMLDFEFWAS